MRIAAISIATALIAVTGLAAHPPLGSVVVATERFGTNPIPPMPSTGRIEIYTESGAFVETFWAPDGRIGDVATDPQQSIYATVTSGVMRFDADGTVTLLRLPGSGTLAVDRSRSVVVWGSQKIFKILADGQIVGAFTHGASGVSIDVAADQCTVYSPIRQSFFLAPVHQIERFNVCEGRPLRALPNRVRSNGGIRLLPSGEILIANTNGVDLLTADGAEIRTYPFPNDFGAYLAIARTGEAFWVAADRTAILIDLASGATLASLTTDDAIIGIAVMGEPRAAFAEPAAIPLFSPATAILLLAALAGVGLFALPRL